MISYIEHILDIIVNIISSLGYWGVGIGMAIESACIPLPSEIILPLGGYLASTGQITFWGAVLAGTIGGTIGSIVAYFVGVYGGRPFILKYGRYVLINEKEFDKADKWFAKYGDAAVFISRLLPIIRTFISLPAGIAKVNFKRFVIYTFAGSLPWSIALTYAGYVLGQNWRDIKKYLHGADYIIGAILLVLIVVYLINHFSKKNN